MRDNIVGLIGVFDLMHEGHINLIKRASMLGNVVVGVVCDKAVKKQKGNDRPVFKQDHRLSLVQNMKGVVDAFIIDDFDAEKFLQKRSDKYFLSPINILIQGEDQDHVKGFDKIKEKYVKVLVVKFPRTPNVSSTELIKKLGA